jgi:hypothetical protein
MNPRIATLIAAATLIVSVTACGGDGPDGGDESSVSPSYSTTGAADGSGAGDALALGQRAVTPFVDYGGARRQPTKVGVRVLDVRKGRIADLEDFNLDRRQRRSVPYYIDAKFENLGEFTLSRNLLRASVEDQDGREYRPATLVVLGGTFKPCPQGRETNLRPGESFIDCAAVLLPKGSELGRVRFQGDVTKDPLFWQPN